MSTLAILAVILVIVALVAVAIEGVRQSSLSLSQVAIVCVAAALLLTLIPK
jgi:hypothetical protein